MFLAAYLHISISCELISSLNMRAGTPATTQCGVADSIATAFAQITLLSPAMTGSNIFVPAST